VIKDAYGFVAMGAIVAVIAMASRYIGLFGVWRYVRGEAAPVQIGVVESFKQTFRNDQFSPSCRRSSSLTPPSCC